MTIVKSVLNKIQHIEKSEIFLNRYEHHSQRKELIEFSWSFDYSFNRYFSYLNVMFLQSIKKDYLLNEYHHIFVRDGFLGLTRFFLNNSTPIESSPILIIAKKFESIIPKAWAKKVLLYEYFQLDRMQEPPEVNLFYGLGSKYFMLRPFEKPAGTKTDLPFNLITKLKDKYFLQSTTEQLNTVNFIECYNRFAPTSDFYQYEYLDPLSLNKAKFNYINLDRDNFLFSSHYIDDYFLARNATCPGFKKKKNTEKNDVMLSLNHGVTLSEPSDLTNNLKKILMLVYIKRIYIDFFNEEFVNYMLELYHEFFPED